MSQQGTIKRYTLIIEKTGRRLYPSFDEIKQYLFDHGFEVSKRTIQRDMEQIRYEFGVEIVYDSSRKGYYIDKDGSVNLDAFLRFLEIVNTASLLTDSLKESKDALDHIMFESQGELQGMEFIKPLLSAIRNRRIVSFFHENYETGRKKEYKAKPYLLKEYQGRWYLVCLIEGVDELWTFGLDRISDTKVTDNKFTRNKSIDPKSVFESTIGVTHSIRKPEEVVLSFTPLQGKYVKALPLHRSQKIIKDNEQELVISLKIIPNYELIQRILMLGEGVKVIEPVWLANDIVSVLKTTLDKYG